MKSRGEVNSHLRTWSNTVLEDGGCETCDCQAAWANRAQNGGRYDVKYGRVESSNPRGPMPGKAHFYTVRRHPVTSRPSAIGHFSSEMRQAPINKSIRAAVAWRDLGVANRRRNSSEEKTLHCELSPPSANT